MHGVVMPDEGRGRCCPRPDTSGEDGADNDASESNGESSHGVVPPTPGLNFPTNVVPLRVRCDPLVALYAVQVGPVPLGL